MEFLDVPVEPDVLEKLKIFVPYLYTDTLQPLVIFELLNIFLIIGNFFNLTGIHPRTRTILRNMFVVQLIEKLLILVGISFIYDINVVTYKGALIFVILFMARFCFYYLTKIIIIAVMTSDKIMKSESLSNWKILSLIYLSVAVAIGGGAVTFFYDKTYLTLYVFTVMSVVLLLGLFVVIGMLRKEYKRLRRSHEMSEDDLVRMTFLRILLYIQILVTVVCAFTVKKQAILDLCPVTMFLYLLYIRSVNANKVKAAPKKKEGGDKKSKKIN